MPVKPPGRAVLPNPRRSTCPVACTLDLIGDKWTLLIIRDMFFGKSRYKDFSASEEGVPTNILVNRLRKLEGAGLVSKSPYQKNPIRFDYQLTDAGRSLGPILQAMIDWADKHVAGVRRPAKSARR